MLLDTLTVLEPAKVKEVLGARVRLGFPDRDAWAILATPYPYRPVEEDVVLAIGQEDDFYVIGVIEGAGKTTFTAPGNLDFRAPQGTIAFESPQGIRFRAGTIDLQAREMDVVAETRTENLGNAYCWVHDAYQFRAGAERHVVKGNYRIMAERIVECAKKDVNIDGEKINLG